jgi:hypothetical protein
MFSEIEPVTLKPADTLTVEDAEQIDAAYALRAKELGVKICWWSYSGQGEMTDPRSWRRFAGNMEITLPTASQARILPTELIK